MEIKPKSWWVDDRSGKEVLVKKLIGEPFREVMVHYDVLYSSGERLSSEKCSYKEFLYCNSPKTCSTEDAYEEVYDQAIDDLIEAGVIGEDDEDYLDEEYSEYEFGDVEDDEDGEEEYCFFKEIERVLNGKFELNTKPEDVERKHSHYFKDVRHLDYIDVYQVCKLFPVDDDSGAITHARKKLLVAGGRGAGKDMIKDITEARDTLNRYLQMEGIE